MTFPSEVWIPIPGYEQFYEVSSHGRVRSYHSNNHRPTQSRLSSTPRVLSQSKSRKRYNTVVLCLPGKKKKTRLVHQLVALAFIGERPEGYDVNHINGIKTDNRLENLEYITRQENILHKINILGKSRGENVHAAKLVPEQVIQIRWLYDTGRYSYKSLGRLYGVHADTIQKIISRVNWKHI